MMNTDEQRSLPRPLEDVRVLDLTTALAGPFATLILAGLGAHVIKIENPDGGDTSRNNAPYLGVDGTKLVRDREDDISISALNRLRNKRGITLNLKHKDSREVFADLVRNADVLVENFSRGTLDRLGIGYSFARQLNPRIVYCSINGFGNDASAEDGKAMDTIIQALSGVMFTSGRPGDEPIRIGLPIADLSAPLFGVIAVLAALHQARRTGQGQQIDISMLGVLTSLVAGEPYDILEQCGIPTRSGPTVPRLAPFGTYPTKDGYVAICAPTDAFAHALFRAMGQPELCGDSRFHTRDMRVKNVAELDSLIAAWTGSQTTAAVLQSIGQAGTPIAEVRSTSSAVRDPRVLARGETVLLEHPKYGAVEEVYGMGLPMRFSGSYVSLDQPPPRLGEDNEAIYGGLLGYDKERIEQLRMTGVIGRRVETQGGK